MSKHDLLYIGIVKLGYSYDEFMNTEPRHIFVAHLRQQERQEQELSYLRQILTYIHNTSPNVKQKIKPQQIVELRRDKKQEYEIDDNWARKAINAFKN